jgi:transcription-repair coupling factor (superfamily II helicase)
MALIRLIQQQPRVYKMDGQDKLRVLMELPGSSERVRTAQDLLVALGAPRPG